MNRTPVTSSSIKSMGYDEKSKTLEIEFQHGGVYSYAGVNSPLVDRFRGAKSMGSFLRQNVIGKHTHTKVK